MAYRQILHSACRTLHRHRLTSVSPSAAVAVSPPAQYCRRPPSTASSRIALPPSCRTLSASAQTPSTGSRCCGAAASILFRRHSSDSGSQFRDDYASRDDDNDNEAPGGENPAICRRHRRRRRRETLKCGRARRKWISGQQRQRGREEEDSIASEVGGGGGGGGGNGQHRVDEGTKKNTTNHDGDLPPGFKHDDLSSSNTLFGIPIGNPIRDRYIRSQQKVIYPKTLAGWRTVFRQTWETYLWTFEGFLIKEKRRDADGNVIPEEEEICTDEREGSDERPRGEGSGRGGGDKSLRDKANDAAGTIAENVTKNIITITHETPKLVKLGQEITGASTKEDLKVWVGDMLKLGTACLTEFMSGYRRGRDEEIDRMLHEYFKELDEEKKGPDDAVDPADSGEGESKEDEVGVVAQRRMRGTRSWGRSERRRLKALADRVKTELPDTATPNNKELRNE